MIFEKDEEIDKLYQEVLNFKQQTIPRLEELLFQKDREIMELRFEREHNAVNNSRLQRRVRDLQLFQHEV